LNKVEPTITSANLSAPTTSAGRAAKSEGKRKSYRKGRYGVAVTTRALLVLVLSVALVGVLHWAVDMTNAGAKKITSNLYKVQDSFANPQITEDQDKNRSRKGKSVSGVQIEPATK